MTELTAIWTDKLAGGPQAGRLDSCGRHWSVCEVVIVLYVDAVVAVTAGHTLLFVLHVYILRECKGARVTEMLVWGTGEVCSGGDGCECMGSTRV